MKGEIMKTCKWCGHKPETETDTTTIGHDGMCYDCRCNHDSFMMSALNGVLKHYSDPTDFTERIAATSYMLADAAMEIRKQKGARHGK